MARVNKVKIAINLIEKEIENSKKLLDKEVLNRTYSLACVHEGRIIGLQMALDIVKTCVGEEKGE